MAGATVLLLALAIHAVVSEEAALLTDRAIVNSNAMFSYELCKALHSSSGNLLVSPLSVSFLLNLALLGAEGETAAQIARTLHLPDGDEHSILLGYKHLLQNIKKHDENTKLEISNGLFAHKDLQINEDFKQKAQDYMDAAIQTMDFRDTANTIATINKWAEVKTHEKITDLIETLSENTSMVLANAVYFKGKWKYQFNPQHTRYYPFYITSERTKPVQMMAGHSEARTGFLNRLNARILELPYLGDEYHMVIILPATAEGLHKLEEDLVHFNLAELEGTHTETLTVVLPKFKIENTHYLRSSLEHLGIYDMFNKADFSRLGNFNYSVGEIIQKTFLEVNEEGSEAAAATATTDRIAGGPSFIVSHPFLYFIRHKSGAILFIGHFTDPQNA